MQYNKTLCYATGACHRFAFVSKAQLSCRQFGTAANLRRSYARSVICSTDKHMLKLDNKRLNSSQATLGLCVPSSHCFGMSYGCGRYFSSVPGGDGSASSGMGDDDPEQSEPTILHNVSPIRTLISQNIPEEWPKVPVIAINRNPLFPSFIKFMSVSTYRNMFVITGDILQL